MSSVEVLGVLKLAVKQCGSMKLDYATTLLLRYRAEIHM